MRATMSRALCAALALAFSCVFAHAQSTINTSIPAFGGNLTSIQQRQQWQAAASDINGLLGMHAAVSVGQCPTTTAVGTDCLTVGSTPYIWYKWTGSTGGWGQIGQIDPATGPFASAMSSLNIAATAPLHATFSGGLATLSLNLSANNAWLGDQYFGSGRPQVDVRAYRAVGDGVTNDGPAIDAANAVAGPLGAILFFPPGRYCHFTGLVETWPSVTLLGSAPNFTPGSGVTPGSTLSACLHDVTTLSANVPNVSVSNMTIEGDNSLTTTHQAVVFGSGCTDCIFHRSEGWYGTINLQTSGSDVLVDGDSRFAFAYGQAQVYGSAHFIRAKANNSWSGCEPTAPVTVAAWAATTTYPTCGVATLGGWLIKATTGGTTSGSPPTVQPYGTSFTDGTVTWILQGPASQYGFQCDGCSVPVYTNTDASGAHTAGYAFTGANNGTVMVAPVATDTLGGGVLGIAGSGIIIEGARFECVAASCIAASFGSSFTGSIQITNSLIQSQGAGISILGGMAALSGNAVSSNGATGISVATANPSIVGNNVGATTGSPTNATGIALTSAASNPRVIGNPCGGIATCLSDASTGPKATEQNGSQWISANASTTPASGVPGTYALRLTAADAATPRLLLEGYGTGITPSFLGIAARGTGASPSGLKSGDVLVNYGALGYGATLFGNGRIGARIVAAQDFTDTVQGTATDILSTLNGSTTGAVVCRFENDGGITCPHTVTGGSLGAGKFNISGGFFVGGNAVAMSAVSPLALNSTNGQMTCAGCVTSQSQILSAGTPNTTAAAGTFFACAFNTAAAQTASCITPNTGTFSNFYFNAGSSPGAGNTYIVTLYSGTYLSMTPTPVTCTISSAANQCHDLTDTSPITAGQSYAIQIVTSASATPLAGFSYGVRFTQP